MKDNAWRALDDYFAKYPILRGDSVPDAEVTQVSEEIGCELPADYREFLLKYGAAVVGAYGLFGLRPVEALGNEWSLTEMNQHFRSQQWDGVDDWVIVSMDHSGNPIGIAPDGTVMVSDHDYGSIEEIAPTFEAFLIETCLGESGESGS